MKILLKGYYGFGNLGDDILMLLAFKIIKSKYPKADITIFSNNTTNISSFTCDHNYNDYIFSIIGEKVKLVDWTHKGVYDLQIDGGGGVYFDDKKGALVYYFTNLVLKWLGVRLIGLLDAFLRKIIRRPKNIISSRTIGLGIGVGPFCHSARGLYRNMVNLSAYNQLGIRDKFSFSFLKKINFNKPLLRGTDLSFLADGSVSDLSLNLDSKIDNRIAIVLKGGEYDILDHYKNLALELEANEFEVHFYAFDENVDKSYIRYISPEFKVFVWQPNQMTLREFLQEYSRCTISITDRAHGALLGAIGGVIPLVIKSSQKSCQVMDMLDLEIIKNNVYKKFYGLEDVRVTLEAKQSIRIQLSSTIRKKKKLIRQNIKTMMAV